MSGVKFVSTAAEIVLAGPDVSALNTHVGTVSLDGRADRGRALEVALVGAAGRATFLACLPMSRALWAIVGPEQLDSALDVDVLRFIRVDQRTRADARRRRVSVTNARDVYPPVRRYIAGALVSSANGVAQPPGPLPMLAGAPTTSSATTDTVPACARTTGPS